eukprot:GHVL01043669.1.p1 GENE.GHVL01043669.1~~GHVL01043669.1.p1  ORF type:complete len:363 (+),score=45.61 GHVL01043669.1:46-1134(+)
MSNVLHEDEELSSLKMNLPKCTPVTLSWSNICVDVKNHAKSKDPDKKRILHNVSGVVYPGEMVAIIGASGAGKSTLLNVLSRRNWTNEGSVLWNNKPTDQEFSRIAAYVQQDDLFYASLTVKEHLEFQALLRLGNTVSKENRKFQVEAIIERLGLTKCQDSLIGDPNHQSKRGISGGERKRLGVASEIITNPSVLFCDEPTSGLDTFMAASVVKVMRSLSRSGRTVMATIHQPSSKTFALFDKVLILGEGRMIYYGQREAALPYFDSIGYPCPNYTNPADHFIETLAVTKPEKKEELKVLGEKWIEAEAKYVDTNHPDIIEDNEVGTVGKPKKYALGYFQQFAVLMRRISLTTVYMCFLTQL